VGGATQGGMGFSGPGGGDFTGRFPAYCGRRPQSHQQQLGCQSHGGPVRPLGAALDVYISNPARPETVTKRTDDHVERQPFSRQFGVLRAILNSSPVSPPLPSNYSGNIVTVEFWFEFRR